MIRKYLIKQNKFFANCCLIGRHLLTAFFVRHNYFYAFALGLFKIKRMDKWHKKFIIMQIIILILMIAIRFWIPGEAKFLLLIGMTLFFFLEFGVLERQRRENQKAVFYEKSCLFAFADLFSVVIFFYEFVQVFRDYFLHLHYLDNHHPFLLIYIVLRKFYIMKNYSYEK